ncbi:hypothetical protein S7711_11489 [Stachybotrys chartarum IBT 7711]|uniref:Uncharacterized protein n=1 Tax=Stachybotrys chartarum (strain CBS 109288 / IBT 7711) TaxID=1280523 RepID=A0A084B6Q7_STACB|nr:hypothetical protein S7711_11489 [Stachybotrys chartarum IBT 7711]KFA80648.1 hypothetical protein S40288_11747 [Stachybotrys chartarum IBT 40288]
MEPNERIEIFHELQTKLWINKLHRARESGDLCQWAATFHPKGLTCQLKDGLYRGSFNAGSRVVFTDGTTWLVRFPLVGSVCDRYADEKTAMEVETLYLISEKTTIPVPKVRAWGIAADNALCLGPFIMMDFIDGVSLDTIIRADPTTRLMKHDINDSDIEFIYRQFANIWLELFQLNFDKIGCLPPIKTGFPVCARPLTLKLHDILQAGGVDCFGDRNKPISTALEYFHHIVSQDWKQLHEQANSVDGEYNARAKYALFKRLDSALPNFLHEKYIEGPFKLLCDDLGLANLIVRSQEDLTIVGVVDFEWSYIGPAQMFGSPWWLLQGRLNNWSTQYDKESGEIADRFAKNLQIFTRVLEEEERKRGRKELYELVKWSQHSGALWLNMVLSCGFNYGDSLPFTKLQECIRSKDRTPPTEQPDETDEMEAFGRQKALQLAQYDRDLETTKRDFNAVGSGNMTAEDFFSKFREPRHATNNNDGQNLG